MRVLSARAPAAFSLQEAVVRRRGRTSATATDGSAATVIAIERTHGQVVFGFVRRLGVDDAAAADVVQEALLRLYHRLVAGDAIVDAKAWVFHAAYRLAMDEHRRFGRERRLTALISVAPGAALVDPASATEGRLVWAAVDRLPERQRAVLYLRFRADLGFEAVGATLGITASAARSHCTQALATLRARVAREEV
jgi:RNA polymerase sigma factor (sigma-70 family)